MAAEIPPARKSLANEIACSFMVLCSECSFPITSTDDKPHCPLQLMACTDEMADCIAAFGIYIRQSIAIHHGNCGLRMFANLSTSQSLRQLKRLRADVSTLRNCLEPRVGTVVNLVYAWLIVLLQITGEITPFRQKSKWVSLTVDSLRGTSGGSDL